MRAAGAHRPPATTRLRNWRRLRNWQRRPGTGRRTGPAGAPDLRSAWALGLREVGGELPVRGALHCGLCDVWSRPKRACIRGWRCVEFFSRQAEQADWVAAADNGKEAHNWFCRWGRQRSPPLPPYASSSQRAVGLCEARTAFKPRTGCQTHRMRVSCERTSCAAHPYNRRFLPAVARKGTNRRIADRDR